MKGISEEFVDIKVAYIGYVSRTFENVDVPDQEFINVELVADVISVSEVEVQAERRSGSQAESIASKKEVLEMQDNISADQISKSGDGHVLYNEAIAFGLTFPLGLDPEEKASK